MDAVAQFRAEHVVDEPVLGNPGEAVEGGRGDHSIEVVPVARDLGTGAGDTGFYPFLQLLGRYNGHNSRVAGATLTEA